jgi:hypothetical protein
MDLQVLNCIRRFIKDRYAGGFVKISDLSEYCSYSEGLIIKTLVQLEGLGEVTIEKRYSCPDFHYIRSNEFPYCSECDEEYSEDLINVYFYFKPLINI